ncbi:hypothetical protein A3B45_01075 [Candidatus Daviesbacteria bacterium RIFCSPLOWO2_01_FULL_39_12]|uniref:Uncharacterized protein n=1 Tax=Candidatus Daviesbacteria bacterium RIFCSPLOWO2_01_FULL_39_12 TaxID=1797785 RepID=A0A1F5KTK6_9BACT|nr:MAG: hypothetical protein A3D79_03005 [Candidatus Daviesbacteria bacterium RIFCSPHIGHO2_02_FULL_39_8]OGE44159.1 MAG: hypothetical protein A3B45_01075 [Candidatus Daviesbacteria bacterium RIFCSPLOWO2_01_FULL_39_12]
MNRTEDSLWSDTNIDYYGVAREGRQKVVLKTLPTAYYFVQNQADALGIWERIKQDPGFRAEEIYKVSALTAFSSHHNAVYPYMGDCVRGGIESLHNNEGYRRLFLATRDGYTALDRKVTRYVFAGEEALAQQDPEAVIPLEELNSWLVAHSSRPDGLIEGVGPEGVSNITAITQIEDGLDLGRYLAIHRINDKNGEWIKEMNRALFNRFPEELLRLAVYKLACGMAIIDQVAQESAYLGIPVSTNYHPDNTADNENQPTLQELWGQSHHLVTTLSVPHDDVLEGLFDETSSDLLRGR